MKRYPGILIGALIALTAAGCYTTPAQRGAMAGGAIGAAAGQIIGGDTEATLLGAGIGAISGAIANDYVDQQKRNAYGRGYYDSAYANAPRSAPPRYYHRRYVPPPPPPPPVFYGPPVYSHFHFHFID